MSAGFPLIYADPPWSYETWSKKGAGRTASSHYDVMSLEDIAALPVRDIAAKDAVLLMWATYPHLNVAFEVMHRWGFTYKTVAFTWIKLNPRGMGIAIGNGHYTRANAEIVLLGTRGKGLPRLRRDIPQVLMTPRRAHSKKPADVRDRIVMLFGDLPRVELFARQPSDGWISYGNEIDGRDIREALLQRVAV